jgi:hypothetical protein
MEDEAAAMGGIACVKKKSKRLDKLRAKQRPINLEASIWDMTQMGSCDVFCQPVIFSCLEAVLVYRR